MKHYTDKNRELWNKWTRVHIKSDFYALDAFKKVKNSLKPIEIELLGDVKGKKILHLQCHFGQDTLSLAEMGADVTGVDLSDHAIDEARKLNVELGLSAQFIQSDIYELPKKLDETFDIVFTSYGVLAWLFDIHAWADIVSRYLKPGGTFVLVEFHPLSNMFADDGVTIEYPYFSHEKPLVFSSPENYAGSTEELNEYIWTHNIGDVVTGLIQSGLCLNELKEYPYSVYNCYSYLEEKGVDFYTVKNAAVDYPLMYSIRASK